MSAWPLITACVAMSSFLNGVISISTPRFFERSAATSSGRSSMPSTSPSAYLILFWARAPPHQTEAASAIATNLNIAPPWSRISVILPAQFCHSAVDERTGLFAVVLADFAGRGGADHDHEPLLGIGPERGAVRAIPGVIALGPGCSGDAVLEPHGNAKPEPVAVAMRLGAGDQ